ncbi:integrase catalytic domain-containing protein [Trichonephila clavipes]|nr:integrase catalytic domain-containing protein [Trichonephila clavipes]
MENGSLEVLKGIRTNVFFRVVPCRTKECLLAVIKEWVLPGTTIISDSWASYNCLQDEGFQHLKVNHSLTFVCPVTESSSERDVVKLKLPKFELKMFSGDPKEYLTFWSIFSKIHDSEELTAIDKFQYLYQSMEPDSKAARLISSFPIAENYPKTVEQLKLRFGREDLLVQIYVGDLLSLVLKNATTGKNAPD